MKLTEQRKIKKLQDEIKFLRKENDCLQRRNSELRDDQVKYQNWVSEKFGWFVDMLSKGQTPCMKYLVQDTTKLLQRAEKFDWESRK